MIIKCQVLCKRVLSVIELYLLVNKYIYISKYILSFIIANKFLLIVFDSFLKFLCRHNVTYYQRYSNAVLIIMQVLFYLQFMKCTIYIHLPFSECKRISWWHVLLCVVKTRGDILRISNGTPQQLFVSTDTFIKL